MEHESMTTQEGNNIM